MGNSHRTLFYGVLAVLFLSIIATVLAGSSLFYATLSLGYTVTPFILGLGLLGELVVSTTGLRNLNKRWVNIAGTVSGAFWTLVFGLMAVTAPDSSVSVLTLAALFAYLAGFNFCKAGVHALLISPRTRTRISSEL